MLERKSHLLIIPSPLILPKTYQRLAQKLANTFAVSILELPGTGRRSSGNRLWDENDYAKYVVDKFLTAGKKYLILGHSNSGAIALKISLLAPESISGIILSDTTGMKKYSYFRTILNRVVDGLLEMKFSMLAAPHLLKNVFLHPLNFIFQIQLSVKNILHSDFQKISARTLLLWGRRDHTMPLEDARKLNKLISQSDLYVSDEGSHDWILTNPTEASKAIKTWFQQYHATMSQ